MRVHVESLLDCDAETAWTAVQLSETLQKVSRPMVVVAALRKQQLPERWEQGATVRFRTLLLGVIPFGVRTVFFERIDADAMRIQTREHDAMIKTWDHQMHVVSAGEGKCKYSDDVEIKAGVLTLIVWMFAGLYYRHRQRRWRRLASSLQSETRGSTQD